MAQPSNVSDTIVSRGFIPIIFCHFHCVTTGDGKNGVLSSVKLKVLLPLSPYIQSSWTCHKIFHFLILLVVSHKLQRIPWHCDKALHSYQHYCVQELEFKKNLLLGSHNVKMIVLTKCLSTSNKYVGNLNSFYSLGAHHTEQDAIILGHHPISPLLHNCIVKWISYHVIQMFLSTWVLFADLELF